MNQLGRFSLYLYKVSSDSEGMKVSTIELAADPDSKISFGKTPNADAPGYIALKYNYVNGSIKDEEFERHEEKGLSANGFIEYAEKEIRKALADGYSQYIGKEKYDRDVSLGDFGRLDKTNVRSCLYEATSYEIVFGEGSAPIQEISYGEDQIKEVASQFILNLKREISFSNFGEMVERNEAEEDSNICHSHDFCDSNVLMAEAISEVMGIDVDTRSTSQLDFWNKSWNLAKASFEVAYAGESIRMSLRESN